MGRPSWLGWKLDGWSGSRAMRGTRTWPPESVVMGSSGYRADDKSVSDWLPTSQWVIRLCLVGSGLAAWPFRTTFSGDRPGVGRDRHC